MVDGMLMPFDWLNIVLTVVSVVEDLMLWLMSLVADSMLIQVSRWSVMVHIGSVGISMLPFVSMDSVVSVMWGLVVGSLDNVLMLMVDIVVWEIVVALIV